MVWLVIIHVLSAIIGLGPAFAFPVMLRREKRLEDAVRMTGWVARLEIFPKVAGSLALVSGFLLVWLGNYGSLLSLWLMGTLVLYAAAQAVIAGYLAPAAKRLGASLSLALEQGAEETSSEQLRLLDRVRNGHLAVCILTAGIIMLMIAKPL